MLRGRRERGSSSALPSTSLLIPPNPAIADPGSSTTARGGILLNPLNKDGSTSSSSPQGRSLSSSSSSSTSRNTSNNSRAHPASARRSTSMSSTSSSINSSSSSIGSGSGSSTTSPTEGGTAPDSASSTSSGNGRLKFAPLPQSGRIKRSNSITLGVAARAQLLQGNGMGGGGGGGGGDRSGVQKPHWQQQVYNPNATPMWYNGGPMPDNVKTFKDLKPGIKKAWGAITRRRSSSNASSASTSSSASASNSNTGGGGSEGDISSINEEDEESETATSNANAGQGPAGVTLTKEGLVVNQPPGSELNNINVPQDQTPYEGGQPLRRKESDAYSDVSSNAVSDTETDLDIREALYTPQGMSQSPAYTSGIGPAGHYVPHFSSHGSSHGLSTHDENYEGVRSGEVTPKRGHSPPSSPGAHGGQHGLEKQYQNKHWTPQISDHPHTQHHSHHYQYTNSGSGSGSTPGSGANTPRRRMSMGDMSTSFPSSSSSSTTHAYAVDSHGNRRGMEVFGFDEAQLKNRLGQMDLNSRRRKASNHEPEEAHDQDAKENVEEDEVPLPVDSKQVKGASLEVAV